MKVALYARYSSENQKDSSIDQQVRLLRDRAAIEGWEIVASYEDKAFTGSNMMRPGLQQMLAAAQAGMFEAVLTESIDRLSRDQEDIAYMHKRFRHRGQRMITLMEGEISELHVGLKGTMSALYIKDLARRTHRGLQQKALQGESAGGKSYGYDIEMRHDAKGNRVGGERRINEGEAAVVRRIFEEYAKGKSPRKIAFELNAEGITPQRGSEWNQSTILGNRRRGTGIINNELYIGQQIWGKQSFSRDPDTGRTNGRLNDESTWVRADVPHLRIISDDLWRKVKARQKALDEKGNHTAQRRPRKLFSFLIKCGECGGGVAKVSATQYGCASARNSGTCTNRLTISETKLETAILGTLQERLMTPALCAVFCKEYTDHMNRKRMEDNASLHANRAELERAERSIKKLVDAIKNGIDPMLIRDEINDLQQRKLVLEKSLEEKVEAPVFIHPNMAQRYHQSVQRLIESFNVPELREEATEVVRELIDKIVLTPNEDKSALVIDLHGNLAGILQMSVGREPKKISNLSGGYSLAEMSEIQQVRLVANGSGGSGNGPSDHTRRNGWLGRPDSSFPCCRVDGTGHRRR